MSRFAWGGLLRRAGLQQISCLVAIGVWGAMAASQSVAVKIVENDRGGLIGARAVEIAAINADSSRVELRGKFCYSSCTMYLGVSDLCISPTTAFGFHGPSRYGAVLSVPQFEHWSRVMAMHYNAPLRDWFMREARHRITGYHRVSGAQLIALGYPSC
ncbi:hypothetical protein [Yoonia sp.]|uniref:hypothetical protein n=1 Tax=Yoonia sp. TaxID=2212373 RepID=UPI0025FEA084|nr:hypothetical protein [Yoonia sp.]